jgi:CheY-like chemotaxis protein
VSPVHVLVADDDAGVLKLSRYVLQCAGYRGSIMENGPHVLGPVVTKPPTVIVMDLLMPGLDAITTCRHLKTNPAPARIFPSP